MIADALTVRRGGRPVLAGLSFAVPAGSALVLRGPNGVGKSTLLRAVAGLLPLEGRLTLDGAPLDADRRAAALHYAGHLDAVKPQLTVAENLAFWARALGGDAAPAREAFALGPLRDRPARSLSAGQRRRLGLARLLLSPRPIWLLDEPTVSLDAHWTARLAELMRGHLSQGGRVLAATHLPLGVEAETLTLSPPAAAPADPFLDGWSA